MLFIYYHSILKNYEDIYISVSEFCVCNTNSSFTKPRFPKGAVLLLYSLIIYVFHGDIQTHESIFYLIFLLNFLLKNKEK